MLRGIKIYIILLVTIMLGGLGGCGGGGGGNGSSQSATTSTSQQQVSVTLAWDAPTSFSDGTSLNPLTDIATYKVHYGTTSGSYTQVVSIPNPGTTAISSTLNLTPGTYYFVVSDVDTSGVESNYSNEISTTI
jgi:hypothetical protein